MRPDASQLPNQAAEMQRQTASETVIMSMRMRLFIRVDDRITAAALTPHGQGTGYRELGLLCVSFFSVSQSLCCGYKAREVR
jgi:hypothetical protein